MTAVARRMGSRTAELRRTAGAFLWIGTLRYLSYPLSFAMQQISSLVPVLVYFFVARLVGPGQRHVAGDYFTFVVVGLMAQRLLSGGVRGVGEELDSAVSEGRLEGLLVQPISWRALPFGLVQWPMAWRVFNLSVVAVLSVVLGANFRLVGLPMALLVVLFGTAATMGIGILAGAAKVLAKGTDPVITLYGIAVTLLSGVFFPRELLPAPARAVSYLLPDTYVLVALRKTLMSGGGALAGPSPGMALVGLGVFAALMLPVSLYVFGRALEYGRRVGVLGGY